MTWLWYCGKKSLCEDLFCSLGWKTDGSSREAGECGVAIVDLAEKDFAELAGCFVVQAEVGIFFHDVESVAKVVNKIGS
jgi:hypothetical protein